MPAGLEGDGTARLRQVLWKRPMVTGGKAGIYQLRLCAFTGSIPMAWLCVWETEGDVHVFIA
jgi:hypothetical protein